MPSTTANKLSITCVMLIGIMTASSALAHTRGQLKRRNTEMLKKHRRTAKEGKGTSKSGSGKGKGTNIIVDPVVDPIVDPIVEPIVNDDADGSNDGSLLDHICQLYVAFQTHGEQSVGYNSTAIEWFQFCDVATQHHFLCPNSYEESKVCASNVTSMETAVHDGYCEPLFLDMEDGAATHNRTSCIESCVSFVATTKGDCCNLVCYN